MNNSIRSFVQLLPISFYACMGLICGISLFHVNILPILIVAGISGVIASLISYTQKITPAHIVIPIAFFLLGYFRTTHHIKPYETFPFEFYATPSSITGTITDITYISNNRFKRCNTLYIPSIGMYIQLYTKTRALGTVGDTICIENVQLKKPSKNSYKNYLQKEGILCSLFIDNPIITIVHHPHYCLARTIYFFKEHLLSTIKNKCSYGTFCLFSALFLGEKSRYKKYLEPISDQFKEWGIVHFLARSGLHLVIFILLWELLTSCMPINFSHKQYLLFLITMIYFLLSWPSVSFLRALILFTLYRCCVLKYRPYHFLHALTTTCCIILILNPMQLFFLDFQLTFALTGALAWLSLK